MGHLFYVEYHFGNRHGKCVIERQVFRSFEELQNYIDTHNKWWEHLLFVRRQCWCEEVY